MSGDDYITIVMRDDGQYHVIRVAADSNEDNPKEDYGHYSSVTLAGRAAGEICKRESLEYQP